MDTISTAKAWKRWNIVVAMGGLMFFVAYGSLAAETAIGTETRVSESAYFSDSGREQQTPNRVTTDEYAAPSAAAKKNSATRGGQQLKSSSVSLRAPNTDFWFFAADVELFSDDDRDGYYHGIDLLFDVDTIYTRAEVYAVIYLSLDGGAWTEYAETDSFAIYGASGDDEYVIVTELLAGYPSGSYDILIEVFDTFDNSFVADFGPESTSALSFLPLEDAERDLPPDAPPIVVVNRGGGGALDGLTVAALGLLTLGIAALRRWRYLDQVKCSLRRAPCA